MYLKPDVHLFTKSPFMMCTLVPYTFAIHYVVQQSYCLLLSSITSPVSFVCPCSCCACIEVRWPLPFVYVAHIRACPYLHQPE